MENWLFWLVILPFPTVPILFWLIVIKLMMMASRAAISGGKEAVQLGGAWLLLPFLRYAFSD